MALTTIAAIKTYLDISAETWDTVLASLQLGAEKRIDQHCGDIESATYTEYYDGLGRGRLPLAHRPITSITTLHDDLGRDYAASSLVSSGDYTFYPDEGIVALDSGTLQDGTRNVKVVYVAGYSTVPDDVQLATWKLVAYYWNQMRQGADGIKGDRLGDYTATYEKVGMPEDVLALLAPYREIGV